MQRLLIYIPCKGEYIKMAPSAIHIIDKIHKQCGSKWALECKNKAYKLWGQWPTTRLQSRLYIYDNSNTIIVINIIT